ncbi:hypothetical protein SDC9_61646 [bioreactor metagenome]|uniref:Uncharacterized protein n=1 Tax=bioreactor metagenome TaxID=1076179 RepID=A0A644XHL8_9ZZZZ
MYKSTPLTILFRILPVPLILIMSVSFLWSSFVIFISFKEAIFEIVMFLLWGLIWSAIPAFRLRYIEATRECITVKSLFKSKRIDYADIVWIVEPVMVFPQVISLCYIEKDSGIRKKILVIPEYFFQYAMSSLFSFFSDEDEMTVFLRNRIIACNKDYRKRNEPSRYNTIGLIALTTIPIIAAGIVFFS